METGKQPSSLPSTAGSGLPVSGTEQVQAGPAPVPAPSKLLKPHGTQGDRSTGCRPLRGLNPRNAGKALRTAPSTQ